MKITYTLCLLMLPAVLYAQAYYGQSEIMLSYGRNSIQEMQQTTVPGDDNGAEINKTTGSDFLTYRYYTSPRFAVGATIGLNNFNGRVYDEAYQTINTFSFHYTTFAPEFLFNYLNMKDVRVYAYLGAGVSVYDEKNVQYNTNSAPITTTVNANSFAFQFTPIGASMGRRLSANLELGVGYKGIFNGGISYLIGERKKRPVEKVILNDPGEVIVLPHDYTSTNNFREVGTITSGNSHFDRFTDFNKELGLMQVKAKYINGNVLRIDKIKDINTGLYYQMTGTVFYTSNPDKLRTDIQGNNDRKCDTCSYANLVLYRPSKGHVPTVKLDINDTSEIELVAHDEYIYKLRKEGTYKITCADGSVELDNVKFGKNYYVKVLVGVPEQKKQHSFKAKREAYEAKREAAKKGGNKYKPTPVVMDSARGELESSVAEKIWSRELYAGMNKHKRRRRHEPGMAEQ